MGDGGGGGDGQAGDDGENRGERNRGDQGHEDRAAEIQGQQRGCGVGATRGVEDAVGTDEGRGTVTENHGHEVEGTDEHDGPGDGLTGFLGSRNRVETHEDVRQTGGTQNQGQTQGDEVELGGEARAVLEARLHDVLGGVTGLGHGARVGVGRHGLVEQGGEAALDRDEGPDRHDGDTTDEEDSLDHLDVGGALHAADEDVGGHDDTDDGDDNGLLGGAVQIQEDGDQGAGAGHLGDEVEQGDREGRDRGGHTDRLLTQTEGEHVGHGEAADVTQRLSDEQEGDQPGDEEADGVEEAVVSVEGDGTDDSEEGGRREVVTCDGEAVLGAGEGCATRVEVGGFLGGLAGTHDHGHGDDDEHDEDRDVEQRVAGVFLCEVGEVHDPSPPFPGESRRCAARCSCWQTSRRST